MLYDIVVIGGGINGFGCAADAAQRGLSVLICEQDDIAAHTSSQSSKLIHGGLRYLEQYHLRLVHQSLDEQRILLQIAPHLVHPMLFVLPYRSGMRPAWKLRCGLFLYDHLSWRNPLPNSKTVSRTQNPDFFLPLAADIETGFAYYDAQTSDSRLTLSVALQAQAHGATVLPHTRFIRATPEKEHWQITLQPQCGEPKQIAAKVLINAAGPWASQVAQTCQISVQHTMSFVKGSHIVVPAFYQGQHAYVLQAPDQRIIFVIPYYGQTLIGTTDIHVPDLHTPTCITPEEIDYFKAIIQSYFQHKIGTITTSWSGIRTLPTHPQKHLSQLSRDYKFECHAHPLPAVTILSGKLTTYRHLAAQVVDSLRTVFPNLPATTTDRTPLPGGEHFSDYSRDASRRYPWLDPFLLTHYLHTYGTRTELLLEGCRQIDDLGHAFGPMLRQQEVNFLRQTEWAQTADDILWRRTALGLEIADKDREALETYLR